MNGKLFDIENVAEVNCIDKYMGYCVACSAPDEMFEPSYEDVPDNLKTIVKEMGGLGCEGGGYPGPWCVKMNHVCYYVGTIDADFDDGYW